MNEIKYRYQYKGNTYYLIEDMVFDDTFTYPLYNANILETFKDIDILNYELSAVKINSFLTDKIEKIKKAYLTEKDTNYIKEYEYKGYKYLVFLNKDSKITEKKNLAIFDDGIKKYNELGCFSLDDRLIEEIFEIDQNLQSCISIDLLIELMYENKDLNKYIPLIKEEIEDEHLESCFFFDDYVYELFMKVYIEVMKDYKVKNVDEIKDLIEKEEEC